MQQLNTKAAKDAVPEGPPCDRCDSMSHKTSQCPHFKGGRDDHEDARVGLGKGGGPEDPDAAPVFVRGRLVPQPGDGSCLFHSLSHFVGAPHSELRNIVSRFIEEHPQEKVVGTPLHKWIEWDSSLNPRAYAARMRTAGSWGGALEMAVLAHIKDMVVYVYEKDPKTAAGSFKRIAHFGEESGDGGQKRVAHVLYRGRVHYDALEVTSQPESSFV